MLVTSDLHCQPVVEFSRSVGPDGNTAHSKRILQTAEWVKEQVELGEWLLVNGDLTTTPGLLTGETIHLLGQLEEVWSSLYRVYNLGNHDLSSKYLGHRNLELLSSGDLTVVPPAGVFQVKWDAEPGEDRVNVYVVPFTHDEDQQRALLAEIPDGAVVAVHYPIKGVRMTPEISEEGGLSIEDFARFKLTWAGHYHLPQIVYPQIRVNMNYLGVAPEVLEEQVTAGGCQIIRPGMQPSVTKWRLGVEGVEEVRDGIHVRSIRYCHCQCY